MSTLPDPDPKLTDRSSQFGQAEPTINEPTIQEIRTWKAKKLLKWIQQKVSIPLEPDDEEKFLNARTDGEVFLECAGSGEFFREAGLSLGASHKLTKLARNTISKKSKYSIMDV